MVELEYRSFISSTDKVFCETKMKGTFGGKRGGEGFCFNNLRYLNVKGGYWFVWAYVSLLVAILISISFKALDYSSKSWRSRKEIHVGRRLSA